MGVRAGYSDTFIFPSGSNTSAAGRWGYVHAVTAPTRPRRCGGDFVGAPRSDVVLRAMHPERMEGVTSVSSEWAVVPLAVPFSRRLIIVAPCVQRA
jgi:hypothetical protein